MKLGATYRVVGAFLFVSMGVIACVSDQQGLVTDAGGGGGSDDAGGTTTDAQTSNEAAPDDSGSVTTPDANDSGPKTCNTINPAMAPQIADVTCVGSKPPVINGGGVIPAGNYYLASEKVYLGVPSNCVDAGLSDFHAVAVVTNPDAGLEADLQIANDLGAGQRRNVHFEPADGGFAAAIDSCPDNGTTTFGYKIDTTSGTQLITREGSVIRTFTKF